VSEKSQQPNANVKYIKQAYWRHDNCPFLELRSVYDSSQPYKAHSHKQLSIGAIEKGVALTNFEGVDTVVREGDLVLIEPDKVHSCNPQPGHTRSYHMLYLDREWCCKRLSGLFKTPVKTIHCDQFVVKDRCLFGAYMKLIKYVADGNLTSISQHLEQLMDTIFSRYVTWNDDALEDYEIVPYIKKMLAIDLASPPSLDDLANEIGFSKETLIRAFKRHTGLPPKAFLSNLRVEKAKALLKDGASVTDVVAETGFVDQSHFHRVFVSHTASTPRQYQRAQTILYNN